MSLLTAQDFENIFKFYLEINSRYNDFENATLSAMAQLFGIHLTTYAIFDQHEDGQRFCRRITSHCIRADELEAYRRGGYQCDMFFNQIRRLRYSNASSYVHTTNDFDPEEFAKSDYGKVLAGSGIAHQAILGGAGSTHMPIHILGVYKMEQEGNFTPWELELFHYIGRAFSESMGLYKKYLRRSQAMAATACFGDTLAVGFAILDQRGELLSSNEKFLAYSSALSDQPSVNDVARELLSAVAAEQGGDTAALPSLAQSRRSGCTITVQRKKVPLNGEIETFTFLTVDRDMTAEPASHARLELMTRYDLTEREAEVVEFILSGARNAEIAEALYIGMSTVKTHIRNIFLKLDVTTRTELLRKLKADQFATK